MVVVATFLALKCTISASNSRVNSRMMKHLLPTITTVGVAVASSNSHQFHPHTTAAPTTFLITIKTTTIGIIEPIPVPILELKEPLEWPQEVPRSSISNISGSSSSGSNIATPRAIVPVGINRTTQIQT